MSKKKSDKNGNLFIVIYTVAGCEACSIMKKLVSQAVTAEDNLKITTDEIGTDEASLKKQRLLGIKDFPTTVLYKHTELGNDIAMFAISGTCTIKDFRTLLLKYIK